MNRILDIISTLKMSWPLMAICAFYVYLAVHALSGSQGLVQWSQYEKDIVRLNTKLEAMHARKSELEARRDRLSSQHLDLDDLDIKAREYVFLAKPEEFTIWLDPKP